MTGVFWALAVAAGLFVLACIGTVLMLWLYERKEGGE